MNVESKKERNMKKENGNDMPFKADEVNWDELSGEMDTLLRGE